MLTSYAKLLGGVSLVLLFMNPNQLSAQTFSICGQTYDLPSDKEVDEAVDAMVESAGIYDDTELQNYVRDVGSTGTF